jgi:hypothetical protein
MPGLGVPDSIWLMIERDHPVAHPIRIYPQALHTRGSMAAGHDFSQILLTRTRDIQNARILFDLPSWMHRMWLHDRHGCVRFPHSRSFTVTA